MVIGRLVHLYHITKASQTYMNYVLRTLTGKQHLKNIPVSLKPYGFVPSDYQSVIEALELEFSVRMSPVSKEIAYFVDSDKAILRVETDRPQDLFTLYKTLVAEDYTDCYEMDWPFELRHLNECGYGIVIDIPESHAEVRAVTDPKIIENLPPYRWAFISMVLDDGFDMRDYKQTRILLVCATDGQTGEVFEFRDDPAYPDERVLLEQLFTFLQSYDLPITWSSYEYYFLKRRCTHLGIQVDWNDWCWLALQILVMKHQPSIARRMFELGEFAQEALGLSEPELTNGYYQIYQSDSDRLRAYCTEAVQLMYQANCKLKIVEMEFILAELLGVPLEVLDHPSRMVTKRAIDKSLTHPRRCLWRSRIKHPEELIEGPITLAPMQGFHRNVAILDYFSLFNCIMQVWGISPEQWNPGTATFDRFPREKGIFVEILEDYTQKMEEIKQLRNAAETDDEWEQYEHFRKALKPPILMLWGVIASRRNRFFKREVAEAIITRAQALLSLAVTYIEKKTHFDVIYGDVDSVMVRMPVTWSSERCVEAGQALAAEITQMLWEKFRAEEVPEDRVQLLRLKLEAFYVTYLLVDVKKRYSGMRIWQDGKGFTPPMLHSVGHEINRTDRCPFVRKLQVDLLRMIHTQIPLETIIRFLRFMKTNLFAGKHDKDLVIAVRLSKLIRKYNKKFAPAHAAKILRRQGKFQPHLKVKYVYLSHREVWPTGHQIPQKQITREGYAHIWENRTMTWLPKLLDPFIPPAQLRMALEGVRTLDSFLNQEKSTLSDETMPV